MTPELRAWLLDCPELTAVSTLALDAAACGLVNLAEALPRAIAADVRIRTSYALHPTRLRRVNFALSQARRLRHCRVDVEGGVAVLSGPIGGGAVVAETEGHALLEFAGAIPHTLADAMVGRPLSQLITSPLLDRRPYVVDLAMLGGDATLLRFAAPSVAIERIRAAVGRLTP